MSPLVLTFPLLPYSVEKKALTLSCPGRAGPHVWSWKLRRQWWQGMMKRTSSLRRCSSGHRVAWDWSPGIALTSLLSRSGYVGRRVCLRVCQGDVEPAWLKALVSLHPIAPVMIWRVLKTQERSVKNHWFSRECTGLGLTRHPSVRSSTLWSLRQFSLHLGSLISSKEKQCPMCKRLSEQRPPTGLRTHIGYEQNDETVVWLCLISGKNGPVAPWKTKVFSRKF